MRIALVCPYSLDVAGGVGTHVLGLARWLHAQGEEPVVVAPGRAACDEDFPVHTLGSSVPLRWNGAVARLALDPRQARRAVELTRDADVVHVHEPLTPGIAHAVARAADRLLVTHHAHFEVPRPLQALLRARARSLGARDAVAVSDSAARTALAATGARPDVIPNAIEMPGEPQHATVPGRVLFLGRRSDPRKGHAIFTALRSRLAGEAEFVEFVDGTTPWADVAAALESAEALVAPNLGGESFGLVLAEALARGCGIVASDLPAFRAVVDDSRLVDWFPPGDVEGAAEAVRRRLSAGTDAQLARESARRYSWDTVGPLLHARCRTLALG